MNILALDTSMGACSAAVLRSDGAKPKLFARQKLMERGHAEALMPMVAETMAEAGLAFASPACASPLPRRAAWRW
jgi:tRNA threonylcarbamoyladenosine biosynthesis protein TsaB